MRGKLRLLAEPLVAAGDATHESVDAFVARRFGREVAERLVAPALTGIYAGDTSRLGAEAVLGPLAAGEATHGSVTRGLLSGALRGREPRGLPGTWSAREGLGALCEALVRPLGDALALGTRVAKIGHEGGAWLVEAERGGALRARAVLLATPALEAAELLGGVDAGAAETIARIETVPIASIAVSVSLAAVREPIEGFGFLVPGDAGMKLLGCLYMSRLFPDRAPPERALLACMLGGARWPHVTQATDDALAHVLDRELERILGLSAPLQVLDIAHWPRAIPQPRPGHARLVANLRDRLSRSAPGLALAGSWLDGVSLSDTIACGARAADDLLAGPLR
jgi:oxygen-dependent protoporphyrinogen oxidase